MVVAVGLVVIKNSVSKYDSGSRGGIGSGGRVFFTLVIIIAAAMVVQRVTNIITKIKTK